jgi:hypothetical protein
MIDVNEVAEFFEKKKEQDRIEHAFILQKLSLLDEGLKRLRVLAEPFREMGCEVRMDSHLHQLTITAQVDTDGLKWFYRHVRDKKRDS